MSIHNPAPGQYATHADLNQLRREIRADVRYEVKELTQELRDAVREIKSEQTTSKQFNTTTYLTVFNAALMLYYVIRTHY